MSHLQNVCPSKCQNVGVLQMGRRTETSTIFIVLIKIQVYRIKHLENCQLGRGVYVELHGCGEGGGGGVERVPATAGDQGGVHHLAKHMTAVTAICR